MYIILGKNGYIAGAIIKELKSRDLPHVAWSSYVDNFLSKVFELLDLKT
jgi:hypothetical protein